MEGTSKASEFQNAYLQYRDGKSVIPKFPLAFLLVSFFYCLPLGRYSIGGFDSDFRIFDFAILFSFLFYAGNAVVMSGIRSVWNSNWMFTRWIKVLIILLLVSFFIALVYSGSAYVLPRLIRLYRFVAYLIVPFLVVSVIRNKRDFLIFFKLYFGLIVLVGLLAFLQGLNYLPHFWPEYWRIMYGENDAPVATLSPHHKHIGVLMMVGVCLSIGYWLMARNWLMKMMLVVICLVLFAVPLFSGTRTYLLGFTGILPALFIVSGSRIIVPILIMVVSSLLFLQNYGDAITNRVERKFDERVSSRVEKLGYEGLYRERTVIYWDILEAIGKNPYILVTGVGFQNVRSFIAATGAHNNYLEALMELGIAGLFAFISIFISLSKNLRQTFRNIRDKDISLVAIYTWVALCGVLMTMLVGETYWGQAAMFTLAGQLSFIFGLAVSPLFWIKRHFNQQSKTISAVGTLRQ